MSETNRKRLRQTSILDCYGTDKCRKIITEVESKMSNANKFEPQCSSRRDLLSAAAEKRLLSSRGTDSQQANSDDMAGSSESFPWKLDMSPVHRSGVSDVVLISSEDDERSKASACTTDLFDASTEEGDDDDNVLLLGTPISEMKTRQTCSSPLLPLRPSRSHTILFDADSTFDGRHPPTPWPRQFVDRWDGDHVRMPCSRSNIYPIEDTGALNPRLVGRWDLITNALSRKMTSWEDLKDAILSYNMRYSQQWNFHNLRKLLDDFDELERDEFFETTLPKMAQLAIKLPELCTGPIPLLKKGTTCTITIGQLQIASLLANAFFCTFPRRNSLGKNSEYSSYPSINFICLFNGYGKKREQQQNEKLKCLLNYFRRVTTKEPCGSVSFKRQHLTHFPSWKESERQFPDLHITSGGTIEDSDGMLQVDFANKLIGGGVLRCGCVQEEIRFIICPELIISRLFTEELGSNEAVVITGCERFSNYTGYADTFKWSGDYVEMTTRDSWGRRVVDVLAIDAKPFLGGHQKEQQYAPEWLEREINKAYCGFVCPGVQSTNMSAVATGNWGCGAFGGDPRLKTLLQLMAAAEASRDVVYFTFGNRELCRDIYEMHKFLRKERATVGFVWSILEQFHSKCSQLKSKGHSKSLYNFVCEMVTDYFSDTEIEDCNETMPH